MTGNNSNQTFVQDEPLSVRQFYHDYIAAINAKDWSLVSTFAQPTISHNGKTMTNLEYAHMVERTSGAYPGIRFMPEITVCDENQNGNIACRIRFDFDDSRCSFHEHVFYSLRSGKLADVWSIIDTPKDVTK